jgi:putative transposase
MPRGNRHRLAGYVWHITERCHRKQFLLKFARDRRNWIRWLYATAVDTEEYLVRCLVYIDLNMVRARVVRHPREWRESGYHEIQSPPERYRIIDRDALCEVIGVGGERLATVQNEWIDSSLAGGHLERRKEWSEAVAVGRRSFVERMQEELGARPRYRRVEDINGLSILRDGEEPYSPHLGGQIAALTYFPHIAGVILPGFLRAARGGVR